MKQCQECGNSVIGRADKKFCSDMCRNSYNNRLNAEEYNIIRNVNYQLKKNRRILEALCPEEKVKTTRSNLLSKGFSFTHITSLRPTQKGNVYAFVYDFGYLELDNDFFLIVKDNRAEKI